MKWFTPKKEPPRISRWLLNKTFCRDTDTAAGDFEEVFHQIKKQRGATTARMWYRSQVLISLFPFLLSTIKWRLEMIKNYLKSIFRIIKKHKTFSLINILGLTLALCCMMFLWLYISHENSYDNYHRDFDRIFRVSMVNKSKQGTTRYAPVSWAVATTLKKDFPQVAYTARLGDMYEPLVMNQGVKFIEHRVFYADPDIFQIFSTMFLKGNPDIALSKSNSLVITESMAKKYFGEQEPLGKTLKVGRYLCQITGVVADCSSNTHWKYNMIVSVSTLFEKNWESDWFSTVYYTYIKLLADTDVISFAREIKPLRDIHVGKRSGESNTYQLVPLRDIHHASGHHFEIEPPGNVTYIILFSIIAIFILFIAAVNYINMSTALSLNRSREVGIRKVVGAQRKQLVGQFLSESFVIAFISMFTALVLANILLPTFNQLAGINIKFLKLLQLKNLLFFFLVTVTFAFLAGSFPALSLSSFSPSIIFRKMTANKSSGFLLRRVMVWGQFSICIALMIMTLGIFKQVNFMKNRDLGFAKQEKLCLHIRGGSFSKGLGLSKNFEVIKHEFMKNPSVKKASSSSSVPGIPSSNFSLKLMKTNTVKSQSMYHLYVDHDFVSVFQLKKLAGKNFIINQKSDFAKKESRSGFILNRTAIEALGFQIPEKALNAHIQSGLRGRTGRIIGVVEDFHFRGLQQPVEPLVLEYLPHLFDTLTLEVNTSNSKELMKNIRLKWEQLFPAFPFEYFFLNENFNRLYRSEERMGKLIGIFSLLGMAIACMGLWGMALFTVENRTKEVGIRKVLGASVYKIITLLSKDFIKIVLMANILSWPIAYYLTNQWLADFAKKIELGFDIFFVAGGLALLIALATIGYQSIKAALVNPINSIKYE